MITAIQNTNLKSQPSFGQFGRTLAGPDASYLVLNNKDLLPTTKDAKNLGLITLGLAVVTASAFVINKLSDKNN